MTDNNISYKEVLTPAKKMSMDMVKEYCMVGNMPEEKKSEAIKEIMLQPYMDEVYSGHIEPRDIKEFVEIMANSSPSKKTSVISTFAHNVLTTDNFGNNEGSIDNVREKLVLINMLKNQFEGDMAKFAKKKEAERNPVKPENKWWEKALRKAGNMVRAFAIAGGVAMIAGGTYLGVKIYSDDKNNDNNYGIVPDKDASKAMKNARDKLTKDTKTNYDAFTKKTPDKGLVNVCDKGREKLY